MPDAVRLVALFEALKGLLVLAAGSGVLALLHDDLHALALRLVEHAHLNPASHYPRIFIDAASHVGETQLLLLALGALAYAALRLVEAWGLYHACAWAEVLAAASGAIYLPFELYGLVTRPDLLHAVLLLANAAAVAVMLVALRQRRRA
jgi:uncharacterized membrane protein (DUF2068 family)